MSILLAPCAAIFLLALSALASEKIEYRATVDSDGVQRVKIVGGDYYFKPNHIIVKVNAPVEISVSRETLLVPHNITANAPEAGIDFNVEMKREPGTIKFTPSKVGKYSMYCDKKLLFFESHREKGMEGVIEVVE